jgi:hypothetical protein
MRRPQKKKEPNGGASSSGNSLTKFITATQLCQRYGGHSPMWLDRMLKTKADFPKPLVGLGRARLWSVKALEDFERSLVAAAKK